MGLIVVDASAAVKWALAEPDSPAAEVLLTGGQDLFAPELLRLEGAGAITRAFHHGRLSADQAAEAVNDWLAQLRRGDVRLTPDRLDIGRAAEISCVLRHPIPDCLYLALAERLGAELVTADATTFAGRAASVWPRVRLLGA